MSKRTEINTRIETLQTDKQGSNENKLVLLGIWQAQLLADLVDETKKAQDTLEQIHVAIASQR